MAGHLLFRPAQPRLMADFRAGLDFESKLYIKSNAVELLQRELSRPGYMARQSRLGVLNTDWPTRPADRDRA